MEQSWYWESWTRPSHYLGVRERGHMCYSAGSQERPYLYSFVGSPATHPVRGRLMSIGHPRALLIDRQATPVGPPSLTREDYEREYAQNIKQSEFVLCPRGGGTSSFRLYEAMMLGRVPVIIADQWVAPKGPDWDSFSVRVKETELDTIPCVLEERASEAGGMGEAARAAWLEWFSESVSFHRIIESCLELTAFASSRSGMRRYAPRLQLLRPYHSARWIVKRLGNGRTSSR